MKFSIATASVPGELKDKLFAISDAGFDGVELNDHDIITFDGSPQELGKLVIEAGLSIKLYQPGFDFEGLSGEAREHAFAHLKHKFALMVEIGAPLILLTSSVRADAQGSIDRIVDDFRALSEVAAQYNLNVGYQAVPWGCFVKDHKDAWEIVRRVDLANFGIVLDSFEASLVDDNFASIRSIHCDKIFHAQFSDAPKIDMDPLYLSKHFGRFPGDGDLPVAAFTRALVDTNYSATFSVKATSDELKGSTPRNAAKDGFRSLAHLIDSVQRSSSASSLGKPTMPQKSGIHGVEFIEFATSDAEVGDLNKQLSAMGFRPIAEHINKRITLWNQGGIRIIVNTDQGGFARSSYAMHGTGICDVGFSVPDAGKTAQRAGALSASIFSQRRGNDELEIPAVRGVGGSVIHFLDQKSDIATVWDAEFVSSGSSSGVSAGLKRIDHLAHVMDNDEFSSWSLFYTTLFDVEISQIKSIDDNAGSVSSRAIQSSDAGFRLTMNGVNSHRTFAGRFKADSFGSAYQHVAFATDDIIASARALAELGFDALHLTPNYYSDIAARFGLEAANLRELESLNIMYDRDDGGEYLQLFSKPSKEGFFFEIVERRGGYGGYGGANAPYRTSAQKRYTRPEGLPRR